MNRKRVAKYFTQIVNYWAKRLRLDVKLIQDNRIRKFCAFVSYRGNPKIGTDRDYSITYSPRTMIDYDYNTFAGLTFLALHELGHIKLKALFRNGGRVQAEYRAEMFALRKLKKYYPKMYRYHVTRMKLDLKGNKYFTGEKAYYREAFNKIKIYK